MARRTRVFILVLFLCIFIISGCILRKEIATTFLSVGNWFFGGGPVYSLSAADAVYSIALAFDPTVPDVWHQRARIDFLRGDFPSALTKINKQFEVHGNELMASHYIRGLIYGFNHQYLEAEVDFKTFLDWDPTNWAANNDLAWIYFAQGKFTQAAVQARLGLVSSPNSPWLLTTHAMSVYNLGDVYTARDELLRAKALAAKLSVRDWIWAYPGNDPRVAAEGLTTFAHAIDADIELVHIGP